MLYLDEALTFYFKKSPKELTECRQFLFPHLQSITDYSDFMYLYNRIERKFMNVLDSFHVVMAGARVADMDDTAVRWDTMYDLRQAQSRLASAQTDLREFARIFAINHFENRAGFELNKDDYDFTIHDK